MTMISPPPLEQENEEMLVPHQEFTEGPQPMEVEVTVPKVVDYWNYDSEKETDYVGLKNQEAICYLNSLLQTWYHDPYFRKAVYHMPTAENDMPAWSFPLALQSLLYKFLYNDNSVATKELTKSFGWDSFVPHDVRELHRDLCEKLEDKMKGTVVEGTIQHLFEGHHMNYIECIKSTRKESFYDLQLDVKGSWDVYASYDKYVKVEWLEGDNKYQVENLGLQLEDGDIICYQKSLISANINQFQYPNLPSFLEYVHNSQNMDAYLVPVNAPLHRTDVGKASASGVPHRRNLQSDELTNIQLFTENKPSVVFIINFRPPVAIPLLFVGSGFIWDTEGHIVTNYHVICGAAALSVTLADETYRAKVVGCDRDNDVAVLRIGAPKVRLRPIKVGISSNLLTGQNVFAIGHPFHLRFTLTDGIISGLRRKISPANGPPIQDAIQTSVPINPGSSGGPLLDSSGYLIGINTMIFSPSGGFCGVGFAVPVDTVKGIVYQIVNSGEVRRPISGDRGSLQGDQVSVVLEPNPDAP